MSITLPPAAEARRPMHQAYPAYKDSGVPWLGQIPAHWAVKRLKHVAQVHTGIAKGRTLTSSEILEMPYLRVANVQDGYLDLSEVTTIPVTTEEAVVHALRPGDVLMNEGGDFDKLGRGAVWTGEIPHCLHQNHVFAVRPRGTMESRWLATVTGTLYAKQFFISRAKQSTNLASISSTNLKELPVVVPPAAERSAIIAFLGRETAKIDALIAKKERLIALLQEKRTTLISNAVTRGLDPTAPMRDSGIAWLGQLPAHWNITRLKFLVPDVSVGIVITPAKYYVDEGIPCLRSLNIKEDYLTDQDLVFISSESNELLRKSMIFMGDLVIVRTGQPGTAAVVDQRFDGANCIDLIIVRQSNAITPAFLCYLMNSQMAKVQFGHGSDGAIQQHFNIETAKNLTVVHPPLCEQDAIVVHVKREVTRIEVLIAKVQEHIDRLREYRAALISAAVTGQIDVREEVR